jgi:methyl-accepting chemotaxis protein
MKKNDFFIPILGFAVSVIGMFLLTQKYGYWSKIYIYYMVLSALLGCYYVFLGKKLSLIVGSLLQLAGVIVISLLAGLFGRAGASAIGQLALFSIITGSLVTVIVYHANRLFFHRFSERGFEYPLELAVTFFSFSAYLILLYLRLATMDAVQLSIFLLVVSCLLGIFVTAPIQRAARTVSESIKRGYGELNKIEIRIPIVGKIYDYVKEYFVRLEKSFSEMSEVSANIKSSSEGLSSASEEMNASLEEVSSTIQHISKGSQEQSSSITTIARSIEELSNLTSSISSQVKMASVSSRRTTDSAKQGMNYSVNVAKILKDVFEQTKFIEEKMSVLRDQAIEIKKILDIIRGITEQTDLLALNAAIEAARVGEQGRGFAVVADEIRNLANETQRSSATVENLISEINKTTQDLNNLLGSERDRIIEANDLATQTEEEFTGIVKAVDLVTDMILRISDAAVHQSDNTKELVKQVEGVSQVAGDTAAATEEVSAAVEQQTASMQEFTSTAQLLASVAAKLDDLMKSSR